MQFFVSSVCKRLAQVFQGESGIKCFHMTWQRPYWRRKTMKRRPCWCPKPFLWLWELNSFHMKTLSFVPINLHGCWPRDRKRSVPFTFSHSSFQWLNVIKFAQVHFVVQTLHFKLSAYTSNESQYVHLPTEKDPDLRFRAKSLNDWVKHVKV